MRTYGVGSDTFSYTWEQEITFSECPFAVDAANERLMLAVRNILPSFSNDNENYRVLRFGSFNEMFRAARKLNVYVVGWLVLSNASSSLFQRPIRARTITVMLTHNVSSTVKLLSVNVNVDSPVMDINAPTLTSVRSVLVMKTHSVLISGDRSNVAAMQGIYFLYL